jgi:hypothetical protein
MSTKLDMEQYILAENVVMYLVAVAPTVSTPLIVVHSVRRLTVESFGTGPKSGLKFSAPRHGSVHR